MITTENLQDYLDNVLYYALRPEYAETVRIASGDFIAAWSEDMPLGSEFGFNQWLIHDYRFEDGTGFAERYAASVSGSAPEDFSGMIMGSRLSVFSVIRTQHNVVLKDTLARKDYGLTDTAIAERLDETALHLLRVYPVGSGWLALPEEECIAGSFKEVLVRGIMAKFSEHCRLNGPKELEDFIYANPMLIYKFFEIASSVEMVEEEPADQYMVYQGSYVVKSMKEAAAKLDDLPNAELGIAEEDTWVYRLSSPDEPENQLAEIVISEGRMEVECTSKEDLSQSRRIVEAILAGNAVHLKDEVIDMDTLLGF